MIFRPASDTTFIKAKGAHGLKAGGKGGWGRVALTFAAVALILLGGAWLATQLRQRAMERVVDIQTFYPGVSVDGRDVSSLTYDQALAQWAQEDEAIAQAMTLRLTLDEQVWTLTAQDVGYFSDYPQVLRQAYDLARTGDLAQRYRQVKTIAQEGAAYQVSRGYDAAQLLEKIQDLADELTRPAKDAQVSGFDLAHRAFTYKKEAAGARVDADALYRQAAALLDQGAGGSLEIQRQAVAPGVTQAQLEKQYGLIASATTPAAASTQSRLNNIALALKAINGQRIEKGETFSFNQATGQRTPQKGYESAGAINNGVMVQEPGGGVCQVSTTLFNAAAKAGLKIVERSPHSRVVGYVQMGKDAMVDWPGMDLRFANTTGGPIYLAGQLDQDKRVKVWVYGKKLTGGTSISLTVKATGSTPAGADRFIADPTLAAGERRLLEAAREGVSATTYRNYLDAKGQVVKTEVLCYSTYPPAGNVYLVGE